MLWLILLAVEDKLTPCRHVNFLSFLSLSGQGQPVLVVLGTRQGAHIMQPEVVIIDILPVRICDMVPIIVKYFVDQGV